MRLPDPEKIAQRLTDYYGLPLVGKVGRDKNGNDFMEFYPNGVHRNDGFCVRIRLGWRSLKGEFIPGAYAAPMIHEMGNATDGDKAVFSQLINRIRQEKGVVEMRVNNSVVDSVSPETWPLEWERLTLTLEKSPLAVNTEDQADTENALLHWGGRFLAGILALAPLEELETEEEVNPEGLIEGAKSRIEVNRYERNRFNRAACIDIHGDTCKACGFDFGKVYGEPGKGYIQVHHVIPVSEMGTDYRINPACDLIPLCANCHAMIHRQNPSIGIQGLKDAIRSNGVEE